MTIKVCSQKFITKGGYNAKSKNVII